MMHSEQQDRFLTRTGEKLHAHQWSTLQIESLLCRLQQICVPAAERSINDFKLDRHESVNRLNWFLTARGKRRTQRRMTIDQHLKPALQQLRVERRNDPGGKSDVVSSALRE